MNLTQAILIFSAFVTVCGMGALAAIYARARRLEPPRGSNRP